MEGDSVSYVLPGGIQKRRDKESSFPKSSLPGRNMMQSCEPGWRGIGTAFCVRFVDETFLKN